MNLPKTRFLLNYIHSNIRNNHIFRGMIKSMSKIRHQYLKDLQLRPGIKEDDMVKICAELECTLPDDYLDFMRLSNGGVGMVRDSYIDIYPLTDLRLINEQYHVTQYAPGLLIFGTDGGDEAFGFDYRTSNLQIVKIPFIPMDWGDVIPLCESFQQLLENLYLGRSE
jgi:hypothetical protein